MWTSSVRDIVGVVHGREELAAPWVTKVIGSTGTSMDCGYHTKLITTNPLRSASITVEEREKPSAVGLREVGENTVLLLCGQLHPVRDIRVLYMHRSVHIQEHVAAS